MQFNLDKPIVFFDIESTGLNVVTDRIVQIALIKYVPGQAEPEELELLLNPQMPIAPEAMAVHGITQEEVADKPRFEDVAQQLYAFIGDADLGGYNSDRYDIPMLLEEFHRAGIAFDTDSRATVDVQKIFYRMEPRTLKAALKYYCGKDLEGAHDALADVRATVDVLKGQIQRYDGVDYTDGDGNTTPAPIKNNMAAIAEFTNNNRFVDATMRMKYDAQGAVVFNFGKHAGKQVKDVLRRDPQYGQWLLDKDFSVQVKNAIKRLRKEIEAEKRG